MSPYTEVMSFLATRSATRGCDLCQMPWQWGPMCLQNTRVRKVCTVSLDPEENERAFELTVVFAIAPSGKGIAAGKIRARCFCASAYVVSDRSTEVAVPWRACFLV